MMFAINPADHNMVSWFINQFFIQTPGEPFTAWLLYDAKTGEGLALAVGAFRPRRTLMKGLRTLGVAPVDQKFQPILLMDGPEALRWNGTEVVTAGH